MLPNIKNVSIKFPNESCFIKADINLSLLKVDKVFTTYVFAWYGDTYLTLISDELSTEGFIFN